MFLKHNLLLFIAIISYQATASPISSCASLTTGGDASPVVCLDGAHISGFSSGAVESFYGLPFAEPPIGDNRFRLPLPKIPYTGVFNATSFGPSCFQSNSTGVPAAILEGLPEETIQYFTDIAKLSVDTGNGSEDCLTINIIRPAGTQPGSNLPIAAWIFGGGFNTGGARLYDGSKIVARSIELKNPVIYVSFNYRLNGFGFLAGKQVQEANVANLGLHDQREALRWVQKYISHFGGDSDRVTIWGESAGSLSVALHMVSKNGNTEGLFHAGFMESGSPLPSGNNLTSGQQYYDHLVSQTNCMGAADTLACLRVVPTDMLKAVIDATPGNITSARIWGALPDGSLITDEPQLLVEQGLVARIPFVNGDVDDEGSAFGFRYPTVQTDEDFAALVKKTYLPNITADELAKILELYPSDITQGSPFDTGTLNNKTAQFKRIAAFHGDLNFQGPRRLFLNNTADHQNTWSFISKRSKDVPITGAAHGTDMFNVFGGSDMADYLIRFVTKFDPNGDTSISWPPYDPSSPKVLDFLDGSVPLTVSEDTFRKEAIDFVAKVGFENPRP